jgi:hypothetical protein
VVESQDSAAIGELERSVLRLLCQVPQLRESACGHLRCYRWQNLLHKAIFDVVSRMPQLSAEQLREQLPAQLTKAGLPDSPWNEFFQPHGVHICDAEALLVKLSKAR